LANLVTSQSTQKRWP